MFRDQRDFRAILLRSPAIHSLDDLNKLLPRASFSRFKPLPESPPLVELAHAFYYSSERYATLEEDEWAAITVKKGKLELYKYSIYLIGLKRDTGFITAIAVPFYQMARDLHEHFRKNAIGRGFRYQRILLAKLVKSIAQVQSNDSNIRLTRLEMQVTGDSDTKSVMLGGFNVPHSNTYKDVLRSLSEDALAQRRCRMVYDDREGGRFSIDMDRYGNFWFRVSREARNLANSIHVFDYLYGENLVEETLTYPLFRDLVQREE